MDYESIVLYHYNSPDKPNKGHFLREFRKAEADYYSADEFFNGCLKAIEKIIDLLNKRSKELEELIIWSEEMIKNYGAPPVIRPKPEKVTIDYTDSSKKIWNNVNLAKILETKNIIHDAYFQAVPLTESDKLKLSKLDNLANLPTNLVNRIPSELQNSISEIIDLQSKIADANRNLEKEDLTDRDFGNIASDMLFYENILTETEDSYMQKIFEIVKEGVLLKNDDHKEDNSQIKPDLKPLKKFKIKPFPEYLMLNVNQGQLKDKQKDLAEMLKNEFKTEKNILIRCLLEALQRNEPPLLIINDRQFNEVFKSLEQYFNRSIGSYNGVQNPQFIDSKPPKCYKGIKSRLDILLLRFNKS